MRSRVHLLDSTAKSVIPTWDAQATSFFNVQEDGRVNLAAGVKFDGKTVTVDLKSIKVGAVLTLHVDLIGADADKSGGVHVDNFNASCGVVENYGVGLAGKGARVPNIRGVGCPRLGQSVRIGVANVVGGAEGCLFIGPAKDNVPFMGGTLLIKPSIMVIGHTVSGLAGAIGAGTYDSDSLALPMEAALLSLEFYFQALYHDPAAARGVSFTDGLRMTIE